MSYLSDKNAMLNFAAKSEAKAIFNEMVYELYLGFRIVIILELKIAD